GDALHGARQLVEDLPQWHHADLEDSLLQIVELALQELTFPVELMTPQLAWRRFAWLASLVREARHVRLDEQKLADGIHQRIQAADVHPHRLGEATPLRIGIERQNGPGRLLWRERGPKTREALLRGRG